MELIAFPNRTRLITNLEPSINAVGGQACLLGTYLPFGKELDAKLVRAVVKLDGCSHYLLLCVLVTTQEVIESGTLIGDTVDCWMISMCNKCDKKLDNSHSIMWCSDPGTLRYSSRVTSEPNFTRILCRSPLTQPQEDR